VFSRRIVGWAIAGHLRTELPLDALELAVWTRRQASTASWPTPTPAVTRVQGVVATAAGSDGGSSSASASAGVLHPSVLPGPSVERGGDGIEIFPGCAD
jgi:hypothetical protein